MQNNLPIQIDIIENQPVVSTLVVAQNIDKPNKTIVQLINSNINDFLEFQDHEISNFALQTHGEQGKAGYARYYNLNEQQATLLITYLRNNDKVREFKKNLVKAFFLMKEKLSSQTSLPHGDIHPLMVEIVKSNQATTEAVVKIADGMQTLTKHFMQINNDMTRLKVHTMDKLDEMSHTMKNMSTRLSGARDDAEQGRLATEEVLKVVEKLEIYYRRDGLTAEQKKVLRDKIRRKAEEHAKEFGMRVADIEPLIYIKLRNRFDVKIYDEIKSESFATALRWLDDIPFTYEECGE